MLLPTRAIDVQRLGMTDIQVAMGAVRDSWPRIRRAVPYLDFVLISGMKPIEG